MIESLIVALKDSDKKVRLKAAKLLGNIGDARAVEPLIAALYDSNKWVHYEALGALGKMGDARAVETLIVALKEPDEFVRHEVAWLLARIGDARAVEPLIALTHDRHSAQVAINSLEHILKAAAANVSTEVLQKIARLSYVSQIYTFEEGQDWGLEGGSAQIVQVKKTEYYQVNCAKIRGLAQQELIWRSKISSRRGESDH